MTFQEKYKTSCIVDLIRKIMNFFNSAYEGIPPWDIGRPQKEIIRLGADGEISGRVLDAGCGTGENALYLAHLDFEVWGIDAASAAINKAIEKARERAISVNFLVSDALELQLLWTKFDKGWKINYIREAEFETAFGPHDVKAWLSSITRL